MYVTSKHTSTATLGTFTLVDRLNVHTSQIPTCCCESNLVSDKLQWITYYLWILLDNVTKKTVQYTCCSTRVLYTTFGNLLRREKCKDVHILSVQQRVSSLPTIRKSVRNSSDKTETIPYILTIKPTKCTNFWNFIFEIELYPFRTGFLSIIRSLVLNTQQQVYAIQVRLTAC
jgi:hypothetical protein